MSMIASSVGAAFFPAQGIIKSKPAGLHVKANGRASPSIDGPKVTVGLEGTNASSTRRFMNLLPDWSMLLAAITTIFEKQKVVVDQFRFGHDRLVYSENFTIRSYEIGADQTASIETVMNLLQETGINCFRSLGLLLDGFDSTVEMCKRDLIWVVTRMQVIVDHYPSRGDTVEVETHCGAYGKHGHRREWLIRNSKTGQILTRATSVLVVMNKRTRRLSILPDEVRRELEPYFMENLSVMKDQGRKLPKVDHSIADYVRRGLTCQWSDLDINQHVNHIKYVKWIFESVPVSILESHEISSMTLEFKRECGKDSMLQSLTAVVSGRRVDGSVEETDVEFQHLLQLEDGPEVMRGTTKWRPKRTLNPNSISH